MVLETSHATQTAEKIFGMYDNTHAPYVPLKSVFEKLQLPIPSMEETYNTTYGHLIFLSDFGSVLRFTHKKAVIGFNNPHFIQPLFTCDAGSMILSIDPGLDCPVTQDQADEIRQNIEKKYGLTIYDAHNNNFALVPQTDFPVVIDLDPAYFAQSGFSQLSQAVQKIKNILSGSLQPPTPQETLYKPLRQTIAAAWPRKEKNPDPAGIQKFFDLCREFKKAGKLMAPWENEEKDYHGTTNAAAAYTRKLHKVGIGGTA